MDCLFCSIIKGEIPSTKIYEDDLVYVFADIAPQAPVHMVMVPKAHIASANELTEENAAVVGHIFAVAVKLAKEQGFAENGYRIVNNCGEDGGQTVGHLHFNVLAGLNLGWPRG